MGKDMASAGYYNYTPMFVGVDGSDPKIADIKPSTVDPEIEDLGDGKILLYVLDTNRKFLKTYAYQTIDGDWADEDGWYLGDEEEVTKDTIGPGESLQVKSECQVTFTHAGMVDLAGYTFTAPAAGYYMIGNQHAMDMNISTIVPSTTDPEIDDLGDGKILLYDLDTTRKFAKTYAYQTVDGDWADGDGWYLGDEEEVTSDKITAGGVLQMKSECQVTLTFPAQ